MKRIIDHRCASRRDALALLGAASLIVAGATPALAKMAPTAVAYQEMPNGDHKCGICNFYVDPNACKLVDGTINPEGWCKLWSKKPG